MRVGMNNSMDIHQRREVIKSTVLVLHYVFKILWQITHFNVCSNFLLYVGNSKLLQVPSLINRFLTYQKLLIRINNESIAWKSSPIQ